MEFAKVFQVNKTVSEKDFLREVLIGLSNDPSTPADIMTAKFGEVRETTEEFFQTIVEVDVNYSGSVGYDRQETYITQEFKHLHAGDRYTIEGIIKYADIDADYKCDVQKTRTVTDWQAYNGSDHFSITATEVNSSVANPAFAKLFESKLHKVASDDDSGDEVENASATVNPDAYRRAIADAESTAKYKVKWPGDHQKDEHYSFKTEVLDGNAYYYYCPCYIVEYEYKGKKYVAKGLAFGGANEVHEVPTGSSLSTDSESGLRQARNRELDDKLKVPMLVSKTGGYSVVGGIILWLIGVFGYVNALKTVGVIAMIAGAAVGIGFITTWFILKKRINKKYDALIADLKNHKAEALKKKLLEMGL